MITILGLWEVSWMEPKVERRVWLQTLNSFKVDKWAMSTTKTYQETQWTYPAPFTAIEEMLETYPGKKTFLICPDRVPSEDLITYEHPEDAIYVFGNTPDNVARYVSPEDDVVSIHMPWDGTPFAHCVAPVVLYDRMVKCQLITGQ